MMKLIILIVTLVIGLDQLTKQIITSTMEIGDSTPVINNFLYLTYHRNEGAAFGILQGQMIFFYIITVITIIAIVIWLRNLDMKKEKLFAIGLAFILGGAIGNFIDRVIYQAVIDFIHTVWWGNNFPIFNVADTALTIGAILMAFDHIVLSRKRRKELYFDIN